MSSTNSFSTRTSSTLAGESVELFSLGKLEQRFPNIAKLPYSLKILLENLLRHEDGRFVHADDIDVLASWKPGAQLQKEISFAPARVLLQDFTGVPCVVDLAAMRDGMIRLGGNPDRVNPLQPVELVIDHSVQVDYFGRADAFQLNAELEFARNRERYSFLRWGQSAFRNFRVVPPDTGIVHQVNIEYLARVVFREVVNGRVIAYPDTIVGTDSHTTMVNGLGVLGWGVGGIEAEAAMLGQPMSMLIPPVVGFKLTGAMPEGATATDLVLMVTERLRKHGVVGKFVEFYGSGLGNLTIADRATLGNMCPEYGATAAMFPIDEMTLDYLTLTGRAPAQVKLVEAYAKAQGLFREAGTEAQYDETIELDLSVVEPSLAGPKRPQDRVALTKAKTGFQTSLPTMMAEKKAKPAKATAVAVLDRPEETAHTASGATDMAAALDHGAVVVAAITSCTNTSNPSVMIGAGLLAKKAVERGLSRKPWVKSSLAPGSKVVTDYLEKAGLTPYLDALGFNLVGYGCTTCIGNSGPLPEDVSAAITEKNLVVCAVLSGNRNFEGRIQSQVRANYLASPPLVVAYALAGRMTIDLTTEPIGKDRTGADVYLRDIWPIRTRDSGVDARRREIRDVPAAVRQRLRWRRAVARAPGADRRPLRLGRALHLRPQAAVCRTHYKGPGAAYGYQTCAGPRAFGRQHYHRSHFAGRIDSCRHAGGQVPHRAGREARRFQFVWRPPRQSRSHDARDVCQHPAAQSARTWYRRRMDDPSAVGRADDDLRRVGEIPGLGGAARRDCGEGVRIGLVARLGRQRHAAPRCARGHCRKLRAHPPQ